MEFWTGENPISGQGARVTQRVKTVEDGLGNRAELTLREDGTVEVTEFRDGQTYHYLLVRSEGVVSVQGNSPSLAMQH